MRLHLNTRATADLLAGQGFHEVFLATGVRPRQVQLEGIDHPKVLGYLDVLKHQRPVGQRVAIIGAGGIGFDVACYLTHQEDHSSTDIPSFMATWGVDMSYASRGAVSRPAAVTAARQVYLCQRSKSSPGSRLGKTTGWIHRSSLRRQGVQMLADVGYQRIDDQGLHITVQGQPRVLEVDHVIVCAGQEPLRDLVEPLRQRGLPVQLIGGADEARELDAKRAIEQASRLAASV